MSQISVLRIPGSCALSEFRAERLLKQLRGVCPAVQAVSGRYLHFVHISRDLTEDEAQRLAALLDYGDPADEKAGNLQFLVVPRLGTISPWASKATDIVHNTGIDAVARVERGVLYTLSVEGDVDQAAVAALLHDRMTETVLAADAALQPDEVPICCVNLPAATNVFTFSRQEEQNAPCIYADAPRAYLYEPHAALLKAGAFRSLASIYKVEKLHPNSHLYTSDTQVEEFPGRTFHIDGWSGFGKREVKELLKGEKKANLTVRNFPTSVAELRKRLKLSEGGNIYLFATTLADGQKVLIRCSKP